MFMDAALALESERIEHPFVHLLVRSEDPRLAEHGVHQGRLAMVHVGDQGDVPDVGSAL